MAKLLEMVSATTGDFEKLNSSGTQYANEGYSNRIRLREESHSNVMENLASGVIDRKVSVVADEVVQDTSPIYSITSVGDSFEQVSPCKAIMLNSEKMENLSRRFSDVAEEVVENSDEVVADEVVVQTVFEPEVTEVETEIVPEMGESVVVDESVPVVSEPEVETAVVVTIEDAKVVDDSGVGEKEISNINIDNSQIDEVYQQILKKTEETLKAKEAADRAQADLEDAEKLAKQQMDESDKKVLEKNAELAEIQARRAAAIARREEVEKAIIDALGNQEHTLSREKQKFIDSEQASILKIQEIQEQAEKYTKKNEERIIEVQPEIDRERLGLTEEEDKTAKIEAILTALTSPIGLDVSQDSVVDFSAVSEDEITYRKVA